MQPGLPRAVPMGIVGFVIGALVAILIRLAQGLDPDPVNPYSYVGSAMVLGAFFSSGFFVWGMGAFDPRMNIHGDHVPPEYENPVETPLAILGGFTWRITFWLIVLVMVIAALAFLPSGPTIRSVHQNEGNVAAVGYAAVGDIYQSVREFIQTATGIVIPPLDATLGSIQVSYLVLFVIFFFWTVFSLFLVAGLIAFLVNYLAVGRKNPEGTSVPWRVLVFVALVGSLLPLPLVVPSKVVPMAMLMPAYILVQLLFFIVTRRPIWLLLLVIALPLPVLVPNVSLSEMPNVMFALIGAALVVLAFSIIQHALAEKVGRVVTFAAYAVVSIAVIVFTIWSTRSDIWQLWFLLFMAVVSLLMILPVSFLKAIIPVSIWNGFAAIDWTMLVPRFAGWLAGVLRHGLPAFLGQK